MGAERGVGLLGGNDGGVGCGEEDSRALPRLACRHKHSQRSQAKLPKMIGVLTGPNRETRTRALPVWTR